MDTLRQFIGQSIPNLLTMAVAMLSVLFIMLWYSVPLTLVVLVMVGIMVVLTRVLGGKSAHFFLAQQRALAVASYVLGSSCRAVSADVKNELRAVVTVNGRSYSDRIFNADGTENMDASRRVVFKFRLTDEQMIQQLRQILESE